MESKIAFDAQVVLATIGSLKRSEILQSLRIFDMVIIQEGVKISDGDLIKAFSLGLGAKTNPTQGFTVPVFIIGDERELAPYTGIDANLSIAPVLEKARFQCYNKKFSQSGEGLDFCEPILLRTRHRVSTLQSRQY